VKKPLNFLVTGVGGQGTLVASDILAEVGVRAGYDAKKSDVLGLAIRGGSVSSHVRWGEQVASPVIRVAEVDYLLAFEPLEALRGVPLLHKKSIILCNTQRVIPISVSSGEAIYPSNDVIHGILDCAGSATYYVDAATEAVRLGSVRVANVVMLGAFSSLLSVSAETWEDVVLSRVPEQHLELNRKAFRVGRELLQREVR
jgi:indolepyruvate ferredoxin oxidoreductase, beta subunit